jgi:hypothetical protein
VTLNVLGLLQLFAAGLSAACGEHFLLSWETVDLWAEDCNKLGVNPRNKKQDPTQPNNYQKNNNKKTQLL